MATGGQTFSTGEAHRHFAVQFNHEVWELLEKTDRTAEEAERMIHTAHASCCHWMIVGTPVNHQRAEWLIAHVYAELGFGEAALRHASRCQELTEAHLDQMADFDRAYGYEGLARAYAVAGYRDQAEEYRELARQASQAIANEEDRSIFLGDLQSGNWGVLNA